MARGLTPFSADQGLRHGRRPQRLARAQGGGGLARGSPPEPTRQDRLGRPKAPLYSSETPPMNSRPLTSKHAANETPSVSQKPRQIPRFESRK